MLSKEQLAEQEYRLVSASRTGQLIDLRVGAAGHNDPANGATWDGTRTVRADLLIELLTAEHTTETRRSRAVKLRAARITGSLDLEAAELVCPLLLNDCRFDEPISLNEAAAPAIRLPGCHLPALAADQLRTTGTVDLTGIVADEIRLSGGRIGGHLYLDDARLTNPGGRAFAGDGLVVEQGVWCRKGFIAEGEVNLSNAEIGGPLMLNGATLINPGGRALTGDGLAVGQNMTCRDGFTAEGEVRLPSARLGRLSFRTARLTNPGGYALQADALKVEQNMDCSDGFTVEGQVHLHGATIGGTLNLAQARLTAPGSDALTADRITVNDGVLCEGLTSEGEVRLPGARIGGNLVLSGSKLTNIGGLALNGEGLVIDQDVNFSDKVAAEGEVRLYGAHIGGTLLFDGANLFNLHGTALNADRITVDHDVIFQNQFTAIGMVTLAGAHIRGLLALAGAQFTQPGPGGCALNAHLLTVDQDIAAEAAHGHVFVVEGGFRLSRARIGGVVGLDGAQLTNPRNYALFAPGLTIARGMTCQNGFTATGTIDLVDAHIGHLDLRGAVLNNPGGDALLADHLTIDREMFCTDGFTAHGTIRLIGAEFGRLLSFKDAVLSNPDALALDLQGATVNYLNLRPRHSPEGGIDLSNARVERFNDDPAALHASTPGRLLLRGFTYQILENDEVDIRVRLRWLTHHQHGYTRQIYDQLAAAYRRTGHEEAARRVAIAKLRHRRTVLNPLGRLTNWLMYLTVGYGYRTWQAVFWLAGLIAIGTWIFDRAHPVHLVRTDATGPAFNAFAYTLDTLLPLGDLGQQKTWQPNSAAMYWTWGFMAAGWVLTTAVVAGLTGILKRD
jgi:hypothetical protein